MKVILKKTVPSLLLKTLETLSNYPVACDMFAKIEHYDVEHISLAKWADIVLVAPATANIIAKFATGIADDMLSLPCWLLSGAQNCFAPAMNTQMYDSPQNQYNMQRAREFGAEFLSLHRVS